MRPFTLSVLLSTLLSLYQASAGLIRATDAGDARVMGSSSAEETGLPHRRSEMQLQSLETFANLLTGMPLDADCFFVTAARLLGTTVQDISNRAGMAVPRPGSGGISISDMAAALERLGFHFLVWKYDDDDRGPSRLPRGVPESQAYPAVGAPRVMGVAYRRPDGSGHVVVVRNAGTPYRSYVDYQASPRGADVTSEARRSRILAYFAVEPDISSGPAFEQQRETIAPMETNEEPAHADEPMDTEEYAGQEVPMDVDIDVDTGGIDLSALPGEVLQRIRDNVLPRGQCAALVALAMARTSRRREPRAMAGLGADEDMCMRLKKMVAGERPAEHEPHVIVHDETR